MEILQNKINITADIAVSKNEIQEEFVRASGPGGQNVNKVASAVQLRFDVRNSRALTADVRERLIRLAGNRMTEDGVLLIDARRFRSQHQNRQDAIERLTALIRKAAQKPPEPRRKRKPSPALQRRRLELKRQRSRIKQQRKKVSRFEE